MTWILILFPFYGTALTPISVDFNSNKACLEAIEATKSRTQIAFCVRKGYAAEDNK